MRALAGARLVAVLSTAAPSDAGRLARRAVGEGAEVVVTLGGDGTVSEVAGVLAGGPVALAPLPAGNANVIARAAGWPASLERALALLGPALERGAARELVLGRVTASGHERVFGLNAGVGLDAETVEWIEVHRRLKRRLRQGGFALAAARAARPRPGRPRLRVSADGAPALAARGLLVACGAPYTFLGRRPLDLAPGGAFDGALGFTALRRVRAHEVAALTARALGGRGLGGHPAVAQGRALTALRVSADAPVALQADGEPLGRHREIVLRPGPVLRLLAPGQGSRSAGGRAPRPTP